jgi:hypothetical protein
VACEAKDTFGSKLLSTFWADGTTCKMVALLKDESLPPGQLFKCGGLVGLGPSKTSIGEIWVASALSGHKGVQIC